MGGLAASQDLFVKDNNFLAQHGLTDGNPSTEKVFPENHCQYDSPNWPTFNSPQDLQNDPSWSAYSTRIYGGVPSSGYPICVGAFQFLWPQTLADTEVKMPTPTECAGEDGQGQELATGTYYTGNTVQEPKGLYGLIYNPKYYGASVPGNTWVETSHQVFPGDRGATWHYMAVGSGVWINVGNTIAYNEHSDGVADLLGTSCHDAGHYGAPTPTECEMDFDSLWKAASSQGLNSVQFTGHHDCLCGPVGESSWNYNRQCPTEIIMVDQDGGSACSDSLKGGWRASANCNCDESPTSGVSYSNCGVF